MARVYEAGPFVITVKEDRVRRRKMSAEARARISAAQKARWAAYRKKKKRTTREAA